MNRELKFRVLVSRENKVRGFFDYTFDWEYFDLRTSTEGDKIIIDYSNKVVKWNTLSEFTGLYDCNGREIYEGDIVRDFRNLKFEVVFDETDDGSGFYTESDKDDIGQDLHRVRVIGDIYFNPKLLNKK